MENEKPKGNAMEKLATLIVDKRNLIFLLYIFALIFCVIATGWVNVENDITTYLPDSTETRQGLTVMNDNFTTYGTARVMVSNITYDKAVQLEEQLEDIDGVDSIDFDETSDHYKDSSALFSVSFDGEVDDPRAEAAMDEIRRGRVGQVPRHLQNVHADSTGSGKAPAYKYPHDYPHHYVAQRYLPEALGDVTYYQYGDNKTEQAARRYWEDIKKN